MYLYILIYLHTFTHSKSSENICKNTKTNANKKDRHYWQHILSYWAYIIDHYTKVSRAKEIPESLVTKVSSTVQFVAFILAPWSVLVSLSPPYTWALTDVCRCLQNAWQRYQSRTMGRFESVSWLGQGGGDVTHVCSIYSMYTDGLEAWSPVPQCPCYLHVDSF